MSDSIRQRLQDDIKSAMREKDKRRLGVLRLIAAAIKQREVDERTSLDEGQILAVLDKMLKQRRDSIEQYEKAGRADLAAQEAFEIGLIQNYLPAPLSETEIEALIEQAVTASGASSPKDMGKVMAELRDAVQGRADMGAVSARVKARLSH